MTPRFTPREGNLDNEPTSETPWRTFACLVPFTASDNTPLLMSYGGTLETAQDPLKSAEKGLTSLQIFNLNNNKWYAPNQANEPSSGPVMPGCGSLPGTIWVYDAQYGIKDQAATAVSVMDSVHWSWSAPSEQGQLPVTRFGAAFALVGNKYYMHGGVPLNSDNIADSTPGIANNLDILTPATMSWTYASNGPARKYHSLCYLSKPGVIVLFGGADQNINSYNDVKIFSLSGGWNYLPNIDTSEGQPSERVLHSAVCSEDTMYVFGGLPSVKDAPADSVVWMLKSNGNGKYAWSKAPISNAGKNLGPTARAGHSAAIYDNKMYVFGGIGPSNQDNNMYQLDLSTWQWATTSATGSNSSNSGSNGVSSKVVIIAATISSVLGILAIGIASVVFYRWNRRKGATGFCFGFGQRRRRNSGADTDSAHSAEIKGETADSYYQRDSAYHNVGTPNDMSPATMPRQPQMSTDYADAYTDPNAFRRDIVANNYMPTPHANPSIGSSSMASFLPPIATGGESSGIITPDVIGGGGGARGEVSPVVTDTPMTTSESVATDSALLGKARSSGKEVSEALSLVSSPTMTATNFGRPSIGSESLGQLSTIIDQQTAFNMYGPEHRRFEDEYRHAEAINQILLSGKPIPTWLRNAIKEAEKNDHAGVTTSAAEASASAAPIAAVDESEEGDTKRSGGAFTIANHSSS